MDVRIRVLGGDEIDEIADLVVVPSVAAGYSARLSGLPRIQVVESTELTTEALQAVGITSARALGLLSQNDVGDFHTALRAVEPNQDLRVVMDVFNTRLGERIHSVLPGSAVLSGASLVAPEYVAAALGSRRPEAIRIACKTLYVANRGDVTSSNVICGLADTSPADGPLMLPDELRNADLVLAIGEGPPMDRRQRKKGHAVLQTPPPKIASLQL
jgi:hypothetical protein